MSSPEPLPAKPAVAPAPAAAAPGQAADAAAPGSGLTADEQMALFAQELKETDWGHQPC